MEQNEAEQRREEFINAAEKLFKKNGVVETTVNAIVKEVDVAKGLFYYYFKSKNDVIEAISEKYNDSFKKKINEHSSSLNYDDKLNECVENIVTSFKTLWSNLHGETSNIDLTILSTRTIEEAKATATEVLKELFDEGIEKDILDIKNSTYYANTLVSGIADLIEESNNSIQDVKNFVMDFINQVRKDNHNG
jgi:AcrR family transcriptional regulator